MNVGKGKCGIVAWKYFSTFCLLKVLMQSISRRGILEIGLSVQRFYSATVAERMARLNVQAIKV